MRSSSIFRRSVGWNPRKAGNIGGVFGETDHKLAELIENYWTAFAKSGNPNGGGLASWPGYDGSQAYVAFTEGGQAVAKAHCGRRSVTVIAKV